MSLQKELDKLRLIYKLKQTYRANSVGNRKESVAEHIFSSMVLADFFMLHFKFKVDAQRLFELVLYHDLVEIYAEDTPWRPGHKRLDKIRRERNAAKRLFKELPKELSRKYAKRYFEFEKGSTMEAKLARAIDQLDANIHEMDYRKDWKGWTEKFMREGKEPYFRTLPVLSHFFEQHIKYLNENKYLDKE